MAGRRTDKSVIGRCIAYQQAIKRPARERMAVLQAVRFPNQIPWMYVGVDFTGPFRLKGDKRSNIVTKGYILIITDLVSRGAHFEVTRGMNTEVFFQAFRRFISRRGVPFEMLSDEATNFVRASKELIALYEFINEEELRSGFATFEVVWHLNTPWSPHRGGVWERLLRTFKESLRKMIGTPL